MKICSGVRGERGSVSLMGFVKVFSDKTATMLNGTTLLANLVHVVLLKSSALYLV